MICFDTQFSRSLHPQVIWEQDTYNSKFIMADDREEENARINVVVKTSKSKETIEAEPTATILEVFFYFVKEKFAWSLLK